MPDGVGNTEYPGLLPLGWHQKSMAELRELCVDRFPLSNTRDMIMQGLEQIVDTLRSHNIVGDLWVNGSFLTEKINPNDVDVVLFVDGGFVENATPQQRETIAWLSSDLRGSHGCDSYIGIRWPESSPRYSEGEYWRAYWTRQWGFNRIDEPVKGIVVMSL
jgi:hypothetical protein